MTFTVLGPHATSRCYSNTLLVLLLAALTVSVAGCTTSRVWDGNPNKVRERTSRIIPASIDNIYLANDSIITIPYKLATSQEQGLDERIFAPYDEGYLYGSGGEEIFGNYKQRYSYSIPYQLFNGPIDVRIDLVSLVFSANYKSNLDKSWMEKKLEKIQYLRYSPKKPEDLFKPRGKVVREYFLNIEIAFTVPDNFIQIEPIKGPQDIAAPIDSDNRSKIAFYYRFVERFINRRSGDYGKDKDYIEENTTVQPIGWLLSNGQVVTSVDDADSIAVVGIVVTRHRKSSGMERIKITFKGSASQANTLHYRTRISYGSDDGFQPLDKYNNLLMQRMDVSSMKPLLAKPHSYPLIFEFHDDITERMTWSTPVKILLTPLTVVADIVLTPSYAVLSYIVEGMPR